MGKLISAAKWLLGIAAAIAAAFFMGKRDGTNQQKVKQAEQAREVEQEGTEAILHGMGDEQRIRQELENNPVKRTDLT